MVHDQIVISYRDHKTEAFFAPRGVAQGTKRAEVSWSSVRTLLYPPRDRFSQRYEKLQRYEKSLFRTVVIFSLPFRIAVSVRLPFRTCGTKNSKSKGRYTVSTLWFAYEYVRSRTYIPGFTIFVFTDRTFTFPHLNVRTYVSVRTFMLTEDVRAPLKSRRYNVERTYLLFHVGQLH